MRYSAARFRQKIQRHTARGHGAVLIAIAWIEKRQHRVSSSAGADDTCHPTDHTPDHQNQACTHPFVQRVIKSPTFTINPPPGQVTCSCWRRSAGINHICAKGNFMDKARCTTMLTAIVEYRLQLQKLHRIAPTATQFCHAEVPRDPLRSPKRLSVFQNLDVGRNAAAQVAADHGLRADSLSRPLQRSGAWSWTARAPRRCLARGRTSGVARHPALRWRDTAPPWLGATQQLCQLQTDPM